MSFSVARVALYRLRIPLRSPFVQWHNTRIESDNLVCAITLDDGTVGYGEGVPRDYVTGETPEGSWQTLCGARDAIRGYRANCLDLFEIHDFVAATISDDGATLRNAARTAIETALIDAAARHFDVPLAVALRTAVGTTCGLVATHSLVLGRVQASDPRFLADVQARYKFRAAKVKVGFGLAEDLDLLRAVRDALPGVELRIDANRKWELDEARTHLDAFAALGVVAVEDPLRAESRDALVAALTVLQSPIPIVLDEPVRTLAELEQLAAVTDVASLRVSKCGGLIAAGKMAAFCHANGVAVQIGCQAGETAILSAAGRLLAHCAGDVRFLEGSNEHLKWRSEDTISVEDLNYGHGAASALLSGPGLGVTIVTDQLRRFAADTMIE